MQEFEYCVPTKILFGSGMENQCGSQIRAFGGSRVMVVYGGSSAVRSGLLARVTQSLEQAGLAYDVLGGVQPNPRLALVRKGVGQALAFNADFLLAVGGGSVIDTAKAIADGAASPEVDVWDIWMQKAPLLASLPVGVVLTIPAAGSETSDSAVLTDEESHIKQGLNSPLHRPRFSVLNPELTLTLPKYQIACGAVDICMHTMERYFNPVTSNELTDALAEAVVRTVLENATKALRDGASYQTMSELMWAGSVSHNGLTGLGGRKDFASHKFGHELSAQFDVAHGASLSAIWPSWARYCMDTDPRRFARFGKNVLGLNTEGKDIRTQAKETIQEMERIFCFFGMPTTIAALLGAPLQEHELELLAQRCSRNGQRIVGTFRPLKHEDILAIYQMANQ